MAGLQFCLACRFSTKQKDLYDVKQLHPKTSNLRSTIQFVTLWRVSKKYREKEPSELGTKRS